jgi:hypothetical protein
VSTEGGAAADSPRADIDRRAPTWPRVAAVVAVLVLAFVVSRACQQAEIDVTQEEALAIATEQVDFEPEDPQIRLLRQGIDRAPYWIVSLSTLAPGGQRYEELAVVRIDARTGEVVEFRQEEKKPERGVKGERDRGQ